MKNAKNIFMFVDIYVYIYTSVEYKLISGIAEGICIFNFKIFVISPSG